MAREIKIAFLGDESDLSRASKSAGDDLDHFSKRAGVVGGAVAGVTTAALNAVGSAVKGVAGFMGDALKEAEEAAKVSRVTAKLVETTGNAANVTAEQVSDLSESLSTMAGVDDEVIQAGANVMLTFKNVRNEAGKGNKIFDRSQKAALDLSAVLGTDLSSANVQLGKALNDPIKGVTSLGKAGVQFTVEQKEMIAALVESGDVLGAQKIILGEVESQVGGAAAANATATEKMTVAWGNFKENLGTLVLPAFTAVTSYIVEHVLPALTDLADDVAPKVSAAFETLAGWIDVLVDAFMGGLDTGDVSGNLSSFAGAVELIGSAVGVAVGATMAFLDDIAAWCKENPEAVKTGAVAIGAFATALAGMAAIGKGASAISSLGSIVGIAGAAGPWGLLAAAILAVAAGAVYAYQNFKPFRDAVDDVVDAVGDLIDWFDRLDGKMKLVVGAAVIVFAPLLAAIGAVVLVMRHWDSIVAIAQRVWAGVQAAIQAVVDFIMPIVQAAVDFLVSAWQRYGDEIAGILTAVAELFAAIWERIQQVINIIIAVLTPLWTIIGAAWENGLTAIRTMIDVVLNVIQQLWKLWGDELIGYIKLVWNIIAGVVEGALRVVQGVIQIVTGLISGDWKKVWEGLSNVVSGAWDAIKAVLDGIIGFFKLIWSGLTSLITTPFTDAKEAISGLFTGLSTVIKNTFDAVVRAFKTGINNLIDVINAAIRGYNSIPLAPNLPEIPTISGASANGRAGVHSLAATTAPSLMRSMQTRNAALAAPAGGGRNITINMPAGANGHAVVESIRRYERRNGRSGWVSR